MMHLKYNFIYFIILSIIVVISYIFISFFYSNDDRIKDIMINAENFFAQDNYIEAEKLYQQAYDIKNTRVIKTRLSMVQHLNKIHEIIQKGNENDIQEIFLSGEKEHWSQENILIFQAHCQNFIHEFNRIRDDEQQINTLLQYAKNNNDQETHKLFKKIIVRFQQYGRSLEPLTQKILENISQGASVSLKLLWKYNDILKINYEEITKALGTTNQMRLETVQKLIQEDNSSITIIKELLDKQDRLELARQYTENKNNIEQNINNAIQLCPNYSDAYQKYGYFLQKQKDYNKAIQYYKQAQKVYNQNIKLQQLWCHWFQYNLPEAVQGWEEMLEEQEALFGLSIFFILRGNIENAKNLIEKLDKNSIEQKLMHSIINTKEDTFNALTMSSEHNALLEYETLCLACSYYYQNNLEKSQKYFQKYNSNPISIAYSHCIEYKKSLISNEPENSESIMQEENNTPIQLFFNLIFSELRQTQEQDIQLLPTSWQELWNKTKVINIQPSLQESQSNS